MIWEEAVSVVLLGVVEDWMAEEETGFWVVEDCMVEDETEFWVVPKVLFIYFSNFLISLWPLSVITVVCGVVASEEEGEFVYDVVEKPRFLRLKWLFN